ncbi:hypothetical protein N9M31_08350 [Alphaproteobacteria bacterium]|nr:hypothetical protein [Alphaproteobacteria bacterium]
MLAVSNLEKKAWFWAFLIILFIFLDSILILGFTKNTIVMKCQFEVAKEPRYFKIDDHFGRMKINERKFGEWKPFCANYDAEFLDNALSCRYPNSDGLFLHLLLDFEIGAYYLSTREGSQNGSLIATKYGKCEKLNFSF